MMKKTVQILKIGLLFMFSLAAADNAVTGKKMIDLFQRQLKLDDKTLVFNGTTPEGKVCYVVIDYESTSEMNLYIRLYKSVKQPLEFRVHQNHSDQVEHEIEISEIIKAEVVRRFANKFNFDDDIFQKSEQKIEILLNEENRIQRLFISNWRSDFWLTDLVKSPETGECLNLNRVENKP